MSYLRALVKTCIALFCIWHMAATGVYSLYHVEGQPFLNWLDGKRDYVKPYVLTTSQWQRWNVFSPDPLLRVIQLTVEQYNGQTWQPVAVINEHTVPRWRKATELKTIRRLDEETMTPLQERYAHDVCIRNAVASGMLIRMTKQWFTIPTHEKPYPKVWWDTWQPEWQSVELLQTYCPASL
ncbi:MAG: hypothetical protein KC680_01520 [Candidatus Peregrinibacteria bacterium]|nr:hypothetical protein [Candidatus Peregrinibacteria bacterium]MCB9807634.1 hypothetical protein [Candidatus Peribacteria bacterium]